MTIISRISILLLVCMSITSCHLFGPADQKMQFPPPFLSETHKHVEYSVNHFVTLMMTSSPLALESNADMTYLGFRKPDAFAKKIDAVFESKLGSEEDLKFFPYKLKSSKSWTLVGRKLTKLKSEYVATMFLLNPAGTPVWKWKMHVKHAETAKDESAENNQVTNK